MATLSTIQIRASEAEALELREFWSYRELLYFFVWRDLKVRYRQTALGASWAIMQPLFAMLIFSVFFGRLAKVPSDGLPYPLFSYAALVPWTLFANGLSKGSNSLVANTALISKIYLPRLLIPVGSIISGLADFIVALSLLFGMMVYYHVPLSINVLWSPVLVLLALMSALGVSLWLSALNVKYRDIGYIVPFVTQLWLFATPVVYPSTLVPERWRMLYGLNPMAGVIEGFRWALLDSAPPSLPMLAMSTFIGIVTLVTGAYYFRHVESTFADFV